MLSLLASLVLGGLFPGLGLQRESGFPRPLSPEEEREAVERMRRGDEDARNLLVLHNLRLVAHVVKKYYASSGDQDDLLSIGTIGLIKAVDSFDPGKNSRLATFAARCIENEIFMHFRAERRRGAEISLQDAVDTDKDGNVLEILDTLGEEEDFSDRVGVREEIAILEKKIDELLTGRERFILLRRYGLRGREAMTQREIAALLGISRSYVSRIEKGALAKLREALEERNAR
ncbi:MAG: RNA polymerase sporulation sigma factor SigK [Clostridia bacterium]|nr:RNA polymerase sporulation sigma factor SigK [Clostridia bacterium]